METTKKGTAASAAPRISRALLDGLTFGLLLVAALVDLWAPWKGFFLSAALCLAAYFATWELSRWLQTRNCAVQESMATGLAALLIGFWWYLAVGYDSNLEIARWVELALALGLTMEALMVSISLIGILSLRQLQPLGEILASLATGVVGAAVVVPALALAGTYADSRLAAPAALGAAFLWYGFAREHHAEAERRRRSPEFQPAPPLAVAALGAAAVTVLVARYGTLPLALLAPVSLVAVCGAVAARVLYTRRLLPRDATKDDLTIPGVAARVLDRLPELFALSLVFLVAAACTR